MISFPNAKINIGLRVLEKRADGYHNIESIFYPVEWCDALEVIKNKEKKGIELNLEGLEIHGDKMNNLCVKAYNLLNEKFELPGLSVWLLKCLPMGAGLGGGSADAVFFLKLLNEFCSLNIRETQLISLSSEIGSDCTFFHINKPCMVKGKGEQLSTMNLDLSQYLISIICPDVHVNTQHAYSLITPRLRNDNLEDLIIKNDISEWKNFVHNDFETPVFKLYPQLAEIKNVLYKQGALYASMTGSGSAIYGIFQEKPDFGRLFSGCKVWTGKGKLN